jgi:hypothetical protein
MGTRAGTSSTPTILTVGSTFEIQICDVEDPTVVARVKRKIRDGVGHLAGKWRVRLAASGGFDEWDLRVIGAFGQHVALFRATSADLAICVERRLRAFLVGVVPPLTSARRPELVSRRSHPTHPAGPRPRPRLVSPLRNAS